MCHEFDGKVPGPIFPNPTSSNNKLCYFFAFKHHDANNVAEGQWAIPIAEEFSVFENADLNSISHKGDLYGIYSVNGRVVTLGTMYETVAKFPFARAREAWHGFPMWPISPPKRIVRKPKTVPSEAIEKMVDCGMITKKIGNRILIGKL